MEGANLCVWINTSRSAGSSNAAPWPTKSRTPAVKPGDIIEITFGNRPVKVRVLSTEEPKGKDVARELYEVIES